MQGAFLIERQLMAYADQNLLNRSGTNSFTNDHNSIQHALNTLWLKRRKPLKKQLHSLKSTLSMQTACKEQLIEYHIDKNTFRFAYVLFFLFYIVAFTCKLTLAHTLAHNVQMIL